MASSLVDETIYLDHAATTPLDPVVLQAMLPYLQDRFGNPSSIYGLGQENKAAIDRARREVAEVLGSAPSELIFTGGATESDSLAITGVAWAARFANPNGPAAAHRHECDRAFGRLGDGAPADPAGFHQHRGAVR